MFHRQLKHRSSVGLVKLSENSVKVWELSRMSVFFELLIFRRPSLWWLRIETAALSGEANESEYHTLHLQWL